MLRCIELGIGLTQLVRYFGCEDYAKSLVDEGVVIFRSLSYFRDYEDSGVRADPYEGTLAHRPDDGLKVQLVKERKTLELPHTFEARTKEDDILVYCLSTQLSSSIGRRFEASVAVLIKDRGTFLARIRRALALIPQVEPKQLVHGTVKYVNKHDKPGVDWALPERIALRKPTSFRWQNEYRIAVPVGDAFAVENVQLSLAMPEGNRPAKRKDHPQHILRLGSLKSICKIQQI
jgi:hypothetical protein